MEKKYIEVKIEDRQPKTNGIYFVNFINHRGDFDKGGYEYHNGKWNGIPEGVIKSWLEEVEVFPTEPKKVRIQRVQITIGTRWWDRDTEASTEQLCKDYEISPEQIISIDSDEKGVWLYWWINY